MHLKNPGNFYNMEGQSSTQSGAFSYIYFPIFRAKWQDDDSELENFNHQMIASLS